MEPSEEGQHITRYDPDGAVVADDHILDASTGDVDGQSPLDIVLARPAAQAGRRSPGLPNSYPTRRPRSARRPQPRGCSLAKIRPTAPHSPVTHCGHITVTDVAPTTSLETLDLSAADESPGSGDDRSPARRRDSVRRERLARPQGRARRYSKIRAPVNLARFTYMSKEKSGGIPNGITTRGRQ